MDKVNKDSGCVELATWLSHSLGKNSPEYIEGMKIAISFILSCPVEKRYRNINIQREGSKKTRKIHSPDGEGVLMDYKGETISILKIVQDQCMQVLSQKVERFFDSGVLAYRPGVNPYATMRRNLDMFSAVKGDIIGACKIDIRDFFGSILWQDLFENLLHFNCTGLSEEGIATLLNICMYENFLPQGASTSPVLSNFSGAVGFDNKLSFGRFSQDVLKMRYADDILLLSTSLSGQGIYEHINNWKETSSFQLADEKTIIGPTPGLNGVIPFIGTMLRFKKKKISGYERLVFGLKQKTDRLHTARLNELYKRGLPLDMVRMAGILSHNRTIGKYGLMGESDTGLSQRVHRFVVKENLFHL